MKRNLLFVILSFLSLNALGQTDIGHIGARPLCARKKRQKKFGTLDYYQYLCSYNS